MLSPIIKNVQKSVCTDFNYLQIYWEVPYFLPSWDLLKAFDSSHPGLNQTICCDEFYESYYRNLMHSNGPIWHTEPIELRIYLIWTLQIFLLICEESSTYKYWIGSASGLLRNIVTSSFMGLGYSGTKLHCTLRSTFSFWKSINMQDQVRVIDWNDQGLFSKFDSWLRASEMTAVTRPTTMVEIVLLMILSQKLHLLRACFFKTSLNLDRE